MKNPAERRREGVLASLRFFPDPVDFVVYPKGSHMPIQQRIQLYTELETLRQRPLIVYVTSFRQKATGLMAADAIPELLDQLGKVPLENRGIDLLLVSHGGDATVAWRAISLLRERFSSVAVLVPQAAFSAATLLALGADEIVMHPHANLGPVDPQMTVAKVIPGASGPVEVRFGYEDLLGFLEFARTEAKLTNEVHIKELLQQFCAEVGTIAVGLAARGSLLSITMGEKLLQMHMKDRKAQEGTCDRRVFEQELFQSRVSREPH